MEMLNGRTERQEHSYELVAWFDLFAVPVPRDRIVLGVFHLALHLRRFSLDHSQALQRLFDDDVSCTDNDQRQ